MVRTIKSCFDEELAALHDLLAVNPDVELCADYVDVRGGVPVRAGVDAIRIAEGNVDAREFLVLKDVTDHVFQFDVSANSEFAHQVTVLVRVGVCPEVALEL